MTMSRFRLIRVGIPALMLIFCMTACKSSKPREHWWQFWRPKASAMAPYVTDDQAFPPPPPMDGGAGGAGGLLPGEGGMGAYDGTGIPASDAMRTDPAGMIAALKTVYFEYDSDQLNPSEMAVLDENARWMLANPNVIVSVEGHSDERGTPEYNLNLGQRRADRVREYLASKGVNPNNLKSMSYGEERPIDPGKSEQSYALNRRVQFLVY